MTELDALRGQRRLAAKKFRDKHKSERQAEQAEREALELIAKYSINSDSKCIYCGNGINKKSGIAEMIDGKPELSCRSCRNIRKERGFTCTEMRVVGGLFQEILAAREK